MTAHSANLINAIVLLVCSIWAFVSSGAASYTALIPAGFGLLLLACHPGVKAHNKIIAHIAVLLTLVVLLALVMPLRGALAREDTMAMVRVGLMMLTGVIAMVFFIKSFIDARKARESTNDAG
ncbi:MAG: hypothetical protein AAF709_16955 [Pseudomonadota bacterium]